jgi:hypothetical protein
VGSLGNSEEYCSRNCQYNCPYNCLSNCLSNCLFNRLFTLLSPIQTSLSDKQMIGETVPVNTSPATVFLDYLLSIVYNQIFPLRELI